MIEDMTETTDPALESVLLDQKYVNQLGHVMIKIGDATIRYDEKFNLYMITKKPNPNYLPEMFIRTTVINFTVTQEGLE